MTPTLREGELKVKSYNKTYNNGDIIVFSKNNIQYVKRIYATTGDKIDINHKKLHINDIYICEINEESNYSFVLDVNEYYVIGDNFINSVDSREFGIILYKDIEAKIYE